MITSFKGPILESKLEDKSTFPIGTRLDRNLPCTAFNYGMGMDDSGLLTFVLLIYATLAMIVMALLVLLLLILSWAFNFWPSHRRKLINVLVGVGIVLGLEFVVLAATGEISLPEADPGDDQHVEAAAREKVKAQFRIPEKVKFEDVWLGESLTAEKNVCGVVDSDEITNASRFIFTRDPFPNLELEPGSQQGARKTDRLRMDFPPAIDGSKPRDTAYWEKFSSEVGVFNREWTIMCERVRPSSDWWGSKDG